MKDLKFRAWDTEQHCWVEGFTLILHTSGNPINLPPHIELTWATGYQDKTGKDIYDGDILHIDEEEGTFRVIWGDFNDCCVQGHTWILQPTKWRECLYQNLNECEVIGNVWENRELLPQEQK